MASLVFMDLTSKFISVGQVRFSLATFAYLHDISNESFPRTQSLIIVPKPAGSGELWLARWLGAWLARLAVAAAWLAGWLGGWLPCWLAKVKANVFDMLVVWPDEKDAFGRGWLAAKPKNRRRGTLA